MLCVHVYLERIGPGGAVGAVRAGEGPLPSMDAQVLRQVGLPVEGLGAVRALVRALPCVAPEVDREIPLVGEQAAAVGADEGLASSC